MSVKRCTMKKNKNIAAIKEKKKEIVALLEEAATTPGRFEQALLRIESVIRMDQEIQAIEIVGLMLELLAERKGVIKAAKRDSPPPDLLAAMHTVIWAGPRLGFEELKTVKKQLSLKFGGEFVSTAARAGKDSHVEPRVVTRMTSPPASLETKIAYLNHAVAESKKDIDVAALLETAEALLGSSIVASGGDAGGSGSGGGGGGAATATAVRPPPSDPGADERVPHHAASSSSSSSSSSGGSGGGAAAFAPPPVSYPASSYPPQPAVPSYPGASGMPMPPGSTGAVPMPVASFAAPGTTNPQPYAGYASASSAAPAPAAGSFPPPGASEPAGGLSAEDLEARLAKLTGRAL